MIVEKCSPALAGRPSRFRHVLCHRGLADIDPELEQFAMDTGGRTPERVCDAHPANKLTNLSWGSWPTAPGSRFPAPVSPKAAAMPPDHGIGFDDLQRIQDAGNQGIESDEQQPVDRGRGDTSRGFTAKHIQLVPKYKVLGLQRCPRSEQPDESGPDQFAEIIHQP